MPLFVPPSVLLPSPGPPECPGEKCGICRRRACPRSSVRCPPWPDSLPAAMWVRRLKGRLSISRHGFCGPACVRGCLQVQRTTESRALLDHYGISAVPTLAALTADHRKEEYTGAQRVVRCASGCERLPALATHVGSRGSCKAGGCPRRACVKHIEMGVARSAAPPSCTRALLWLLYPAGPLEALQVQEWLLQLIAADHSSGAAGASGSQEAAEGEL